MAPVFTKAAEAVRWMMAEVEDGGKEREDSFYLTNISFELAEEMDLSDLPLTEEAKIDFEWSWAAANGRNFPAPDGSYYKKRFGDSAYPYGRHWDLALLFSQLRDPAQRRRTVLYNGQDACVMSFQFWVEDGKLEITTNLRSSDVKEMLVLDIQYTSLLQKKVADLFGFTPGKAFYNVNNAHILK